MPLHSPEETIRSLRITLAKLEENFPAPENVPAVRELRRIILKRLAELESLEVSTLAATDIAKNS